MTPTTTRCKFTCASVTKRLSSSYNPTTKEYDPRVVFDFQFQVVCSGSEENKAFFASTPTGMIQVSTCSEESFALGQEHYVDFTPSSG